MSKNGGSSTEPDPSEAPPAVYTTGTLVTFGSYPQSRVTDFALLDKLNSQVLDWINYEQEDYMQYTDVTFSGDRYRAVTFSRYRQDTGDQYNNGYDTHQIYWFKYEPIVWKVLDAQKGLLISDNIIDSQPFNNIYYHDEEYGYYEDDYEYYVDQNRTHYASNWAYSSLRSWMNKDFYNTAFSAEKDYIKNTSLTTPAIDDSAYDADPTKDKIFLLSNEDAVNDAYGFGDTIYRGAFGTDYAQCQGLSVAQAEGLETHGESPWWLRTPFGSSNVSSGGFIDDTHRGIRPALIVNLKSAISKSLIQIIDSDIVFKGIKTGSIVTLGSYPQSLVTDPSLLEQLKFLSLSWTYYDYYRDGEQDKNMQYADITFSGRRYRAVRFSRYRNETYKDTTDYFYRPNQVYWFQYEPIVWYVLDSETGLMMTRYLLDSQPLNYHDGPAGHFAAEWTYTSLRSWMNDDFYNTAFDNEKRFIKDTALTTPTYSQNSKLDYITTMDKVFLLAQDDVVNQAYGFGSDLEQLDKVAFGTHYAGCQGLWTCPWGGYYYSGASNWLLRTYSEGGSMQFVQYDGNPYAYAGGGAVNDTSTGIRPALTVNLKSAIASGVLKKIDGSVNLPAKLSLSKGNVLAPAKKSAVISKINVGAGAAAADKTASHDKCVPGKEYVFVCVKDPKADILADGNLLYIDQKTAENGIIEFTYKANIGTELFFGIFADFTLGDVDGDGQVLAKDARLALRASARLENLEGAAFKAADVDGDGKVLAGDARQILRFSAKLITEFEKKN